MKSRTRSTKQDFTIEHRSPTLKEFNVLIKAVGWAGYTNLEALSEALAGSLFSVVAVRKMKTVGMGRLVGDGARFVYFQDILVMPRAQRHGIGTAIMDHLMDYVNRHCPRKVYVHLFTDRKTAPFYRRYGFKGAEESFYGMSVKKFDAPLGREKPNHSPQPTRQTSG